jgi:lysophospholipase L1-like esterase
MREAWLLALPLLLMTTACAAWGEMPELEIIGDWKVRVSPGRVKIGAKEAQIARSAILTVSPPARITVRDERYDSLPLFDPKAAPWMQGARLRQLITCETTAPDMLLPETLILKSGPGDAPRYTLNRDYGLQARWASFGRLPEGRIGEGQPVWADYVCEWHRIDSLVLNRRGEVSLRAGKPHNATPLPPDISPEETRLANVWVPGRLSKLTPESLYPILETDAPQPRRADAPAASRLLPRTWAKLQRGEPLHILAWGDSVTAGGEASSVEKRYQNRFLALLQQAFPRAKLRLTTAGWGGRSSDSFLKEPPGAEFNFERAVIEPRPDLIVMEFVNDAWMTPQIVEEKYSYLQKRFQEIGAEWIILTPHFVRPDWMNAPSVRVEEDPRPYVAGLRQFAAKHNVALADASRRWGRLLKQGIPYITLLSNSINHPDDRGHELFAQALMELFR